MLTPYVCYVFVNDPITTCPCIQLAPVYTISLAEKINGFGESVSCNKSKLSTRYDGLRRRHLERREALARASHTTLLCAHLLCTAVLVRGLDSNRQDREQAARLPRPMYDTRIQLRRGDSTAARQTRHTPRGQWRHAQHGA